MTTTPTSLAERAAQLAAEQATIQQQIAEAEEAERQQLADHQAQFDAETIARYDRAALEKDVRTAQVEVENAIADLPLTVALSGYYLAANRLYEEGSRRIQALGRQGHDITGVQHPPVRVFPSLSERIDSVAHSIAADQIANDRQAFEAARNHVEATP